ncbi:hypothetical protein RB195_003605 [Necator americanus]|uniref:Uncharacterized protein n=1 Tax=Necator americanus TaxID=51031 RepID=A0ABR1DPB9_NECAM
MLTIFLSFVLVGFAACQLEISTRLNLTFPTEELSDEDMQEWSTFINIIRDNATTREQKLSKISALLVNETTDEKNEVLEEAELAIELNEWLQEKVKDVDPKVKDVFNKIYNLLSDSSFLKETPKERVAQVETILRPLNDSELIELEKLDEMSKEKAKEMGISEAMSLEKKRRRRR